MSPFPISDDGKARTFSFARRPWAMWLMILGGWTLLSLFFAPEIYLYFLYRREPLTWQNALALTGVNTAIAAVFAPGIVWLTHRFPFERGRWSRSLLVHLPACLVFSIAHASLYAASCYASPQLFHVMFLRFHPNLITYWAIVGFTEAINYFQENQKHERQLAQAQLELLKAQLHPHFLFNTLHTVSAMMHEDVKAADRMVSRLSDLLRLTLDNIGQHKIPLKQELDFVQKYLEIERIRFQERLDLKLNVEPDILDAQVPSMVLQPLVENSIRHGFGSHKNTGVIVIHAKRREDSLVLQVIDNGRGLPNSGLQSFPEGLGLTNTRRRLRQMYGNDHRFQVNSPPSGGTEVTLEIPLQTSANSENEASPELMVHEDSCADRGRRALGAKADRYATQG